MIIKYKFLDDTTSEVEVNDELGMMIKEMDKDGYNLDHKETRRHIQMSALDPEGNYLHSRNNPLQIIADTETYNEFIAKIDMILQPQQKELLIRICFNKEKQKRIAKEEGVSEGAISYRMKKIKDKIKKIL